MNRSLLIVLSFGIALGACGRKETPPAPASSGIPGSFHLASAPEGARSPKELRESEYAGEVVVEGRVGGARQVFVENRAIFTLVDLSLSPCHVEESCPTPWDYCCTDPDDIRELSVTVELREGGQVLKSGIRGFHGLDHLKVVTARGVLERDDSGNMILAATGLYIAP